jgi:hypothetical protein
MAFLVHHSLGDGGSLWNLAFAVSAISHLLTLDFPLGCLFHLVTRHSSPVTLQVCSFCAVTGNTLNGFSAGCRARCKSLMDCGIQFTDLCN